VARDAQCCVHTRDSSCRGETHRWMDRHRATIRASLACASRANTKLKHADAGRITGYYASTMTSTATSLKTSQALTTIWQLRKHQQESNYRRQGLPRFRVTCWLSHAGWSTMQRPHTTLNIQISTIGRRLIRNTLNKSISNYIHNLRSYVSKEVQKELKNALQPYSHKKLETLRYHMVKTRTLSPGKQNITPCNINTTDAPVISAASIWYTKLQTDERSWPG